MKTWVARLMGLVAEETWVSSRIPSGHFLQSGSERLVVLPVRPRVTGVVRFPPGRPQCSPFAFLFPLFYAKTALNRSVRISKQLFSQQGARLTEMGLKGCTRGTGSPVRDKGRQGSTRQGSPGARGVQEGHVGATKRFMLPRKSRSCDYFKKNANSLSLSFSTEPPISVGRPSWGSFHTWV